MVSIAFQLLDLLIQFVINLAVNVLVELHSPVVVPMRLINIEQMLDLIRVSGTAEAQWSKTYPCSDKCHSLLGDIILEMLRKLGSEFSRPEIECPANRLNRWMLQISCSTLEDNIA
jgi:hypothetical protein